MDLEFQEYRPRKIVNVHRHVDGPWFWGKYSAHPYVGCREITADRKRNGLGKEQMGKEMNEVRG